MLFCCRLNLKRCESILSFTILVPRLFHTLECEDNDSQYRSDNRQTHRTNSRRHSNHRSHEKPRRSCQSSDLALVPTIFPARSIWTSRPAAFITPMAYCRPCRSASEYAARLTPPCGLAPNFESSFRCSRMRWPFTRAGDCAAAASESIKVSETQTFFIAHQCTARSEE